MRDDGSPFLRGLPSIPDFLPDPELPDLPTFEELPAWRVYRVETTSLVFIEEVRAIDEDRAVIMVAEDKPETDGKRLCALSPEATKGQVVRIRYIASLVD